MQQRIVWIIGGLGGLLFVVLSVIGFLLTHEQVEQLVETYPWPKAALANPYLAAERLLTGLGQPARSLRNLTDLPDKLPGKHDSLLLITPSLSLSEAQRSALLTWVANGGHLILAPQRFSAAEPPATAKAPASDTATPAELAEFGAPSGSNPPPDAEADHTPVPTQSNVTSGDVLLDTVRILPRKVTVASLAPNQHLPSDQQLLPNVTVPATATEQPLQLRFDPRQSLIDLDAAAHWRLADAATAHLIQLAWGEGWITVLSDLDWLKNKAIGQHDHAALWWRIVGSTPTKPPRVWLQYLPEALPWWYLLGVTATPLLIASGLWLCLYLFRLAHRFGPLLPLSDPARRSLLEHIRASGYWLWQRQAAHVLLEAQRHTLRRQLLRRHPGWAERPPAAQAAYLAQLSGLPALRVAQALAAASTPLRPREFIQQIEDLRRLGHDV